MTDNRPSPVRLDNENPWPALSAFEEAGHRFFNGRLEETATLRRLVLQSPLTVLFGKSGLGKTSLLQAGLFPQLRVDGCLPVYVRLNVQDRERPLVAQLATAFVIETAVHQIDGPPFVPGETLWHYLHRRDLEIWSAQNRVVTPVFVLDQFEEVFTLGLDNAAAIAQFRVDLADLVENRIPAAVANASEQSETATRTLDLQRQPYKVLLSFREDFLPAIESWKLEMPSLLRNRQRLLPMNGDQAFAAVHETAPKIAGREIATEVVRFVANKGGAESTPSATETPLADLVIEPALLSLVCHGLNTRRRRDGKAAFDQALLSATAPAIIDGFYQDAFAGLPPRTRLFVETELITERGFRKLCAMDDARSEYAMTDEELRTLVNRRLLRIEPSQGVERVELIHDLLTPVVRESRERRRAQERQQEASAATEAEAKKQRQKRWLRALTAGVACLAVVLGTVLWLAWWAFQQKSIAEQERMRAEEASRLSRARLLTAVGQARLDVEPDMSVLLALESLKVETTVQGESLLRQAMIRTPRLVLPSQAQVISIAATSPDGKRIATADVSDISIWDAETGGLQRRLEHEVPVVGLTFSHDGARLAIAGSNGSLLIWDVATGAEGRRGSLPPEVGDLNEVFANGERLVLQFDPDDTQLAVGSTAGAVYIWNLATGSFDTVGPRANSPGGAIAAMAFSDGGKGLIVSDEDGEVTRWDLGRRGRRSHEGARVLFTLGAGTNDVAISADERFLAFAIGRDASNAGNVEEGWVSVVSASTAKIMHELRGGHSGVVRAVVFAPDGRLVSGGADGAICIWNVETGNLIRTLRGHAGPIRQVRVLGRSSIASIGEDNTVRVWSLSALPSIALDGHPQQSTSVAFAPDHRWVASGGRDGSVRVWNAVSGALMRTLPGRGSEVYTVAVSRDGRLLASAGGLALAHGTRGGRSSDNTIRVWDPDRGTLVREITENPADVLTATFTPDGRTLVSGHADYAIRFWDVQTGRLVRTWKGQAGGTIALSISPDGSLVATGLDKTVKLLAYETGALVRTLQVSRAGPVSACAFDRGTRLLTTSIQEQDIALLDASSGTELRRFKGYSNTNGAVLNGEGTLAVTADISGPPRLWDVRTGTQLAALHPATGTWGVAFSADASRIATTSASGAVYVWDCTVCAPLPKLREQAEKRMNRRLTPAELRSVLGEGEPQGESR